MALATRPKRTSRHKKRRGHHHRHSERYLKTYWPYIPMLLIVGIGMMIHSAWSQYGVLGITRDYSSSSLLNSTNTERAKEQKAPLALNQQLSAAAQAKANDMVKRNYWAHNTPDGKTPWVFITEAGYNYRTAGENLAYGFENATEAVTGWMNSPSHRANIMNSNYTEVGFGIAQSPDFQGQGPETIIVAEYGAPAGQSEPLTVATTGQSNTPTVNLEAKPVSRIELLAGGNGQWASVVLAALAGAAITLFFVRHGIYLKRLALQGERFAIRHPMLDITLVFTGTMAIIFLQASGTIH